MSNLGDALIGGSGLFGAVGGMISSKKDREAQQKMNSQNIDFQKEANEQNRADTRMYQDELYGREDNAIQRRVNDLEQAGLSPLLAAGSSAQAGAVNQINNTQPARVQAERGNPEAIMTGLGQAIGALSNINQLKLQEAQTNKINAEADEIKHQTYQGEYKGNKQFESYDSRGRLHKFKNARDFKRWQQRNKDQINNDLNRTKWSTEKSKRGLMSSQSGLHSSQASKIQQDMKYRLADTAVGALNGIGNLFLKGRRPRTKTTTRRGGKHYNTTTESYQ